jgi:lactoylglutathione lyase
LNKNKFFKIYYHYDEKRVINIGGIFFKAENPKEMNDWYRQCLGIDIKDRGALFKYRDFENP